MPLPGKGGEAGNAWKTGRLWPEEGDDGIREDKVGTVFAVMKEA